MIPRAYLQEWTAKAPWPDLRQVEQDLIICRAVCDLFNAPKLKGRIAFRGGTAINKLLFRQPLRYSEDIDLVQVHPERIGPTIDAVREALAWLGDFARNRAGHSTHFIYSFAPEAAPDCSRVARIPGSTRLLKRSPTLKPGSPAPVSGQYRIGGTRIERTVVKNEPLPLTLKPGQGFTLVDKTRHKR